MALAAVALVSSSAWAIWNPDTDSYQLFNMDFETYDNAAHTATDANASIVGTVIDYNTTYPNLFGEDTNKAGLGHDANFTEMHDESPGKGIPEGNDAKLTVPPTSGRFNLGLEADKHTWTFWFNVPRLEGTIIRHAYHDIEDEDFKDKWWEIRIVGHKLQFHHQNNSLRMETASPLNELGVDTNNWHHAAVVIDRTDSEETIVPTTQLSTKIYIDGLEAPVIVTSLNTSAMRVDYSAADPLWIGAGEREFDGLLDDVRLFKRVLDPLQVSILNQPDNTIPIAYYPIPRFSNVAIATDVNWEPAPGATVQKIYFGTDPCDLKLAATFNNGTSNKVLNADLNDACDIKRDTRYYWYVKSTIGGNDVNGPLWWFTAETGRAFNPSPYDGEEDVDVTDVNLSWTTTTAGTYSVYLSTDRSLVETNNIDCNAGIGVSVSQVNDVNTSSRGAIYYWRVNTAYTAPPANIPGVIWSFRTKPYEIVFNTSGAQIIYKDQPIDPYHCEIHGNGWEYVTTGALEGTKADGNALAVFNFNGFDRDKRYDIVVIPQYGATDVNDIIFPTPLAIHVIGDSCDFYFDGRVQLAGDDILTTGQDETFACSGGYGGPKHNQDISIFPNADDHPATFSDYWTTYSEPTTPHRRLNSPGGAGKTLWVPTDLANSTFGPGQPVDPPYKGGGGGGAGGAGGESGRGWEFGIFNAGGPAYGDKEVPIPFGGSSGGWGGDESPGGAAGGGGIEIVATGNVTFDANSQIIATGGSQLCSPTNYPAGGGGGGSVKIIAGGSVTLKGSINVNGGKGGDGQKANSNDVAGGGGGGRVAIFYVTTQSIDSNKITADGGERGLCYSTNPPMSLAQKGKNGTIFVTNGSPKKASTPTPANGDEMVYCSSDPCTIKLKWYSGYGGGTDVVYFGTNANPADVCGTVSATRGQHEVNVPVSPGNTYYWKVKTDGSVNSDVWSFKTVDWQCPLYNGDDPCHISGPEWDNNHDCVLNEKDFAFFAKDWQNPVYYPAMGLAALDRFAGEWLDCFNRTDNGCDNW
jgi:hypothetical protein